MFAERTNIVANYRSDRVNKLRILNFNRAYLSKCRTMEVDTNPYCLYMEPILLNREDFTIVKTYIYLRSEVNSDLDNMAIFRLSTSRYTFPLFKKPC